MAKLFFGGYLNLVELPDEVIHVFHQTILITLSKHYIGLLFSDVSTYC